MHFRGRELHSVDAKGRTSMPSRFREMLQERLPASRASQLVLVPWFGECVRVYPVDVWDEMVEHFESRVQATDWFDAADDVADLRRVIYGAALDVQLDNHGRFVLPKYLRAEVGIEGEVFWSSAGRYLELWDPGRMTQRLTVERAPQLKDALRRLGAPALSAPHGAASAEVADA